MEEKNKKVENENKGEEENNISNDNFAPSQMVLKAKIYKKIKNFYIFPNGNILIFNNYFLSIYQSKTLKQLIKYENNNYIVGDIIILSNNTLLLFIYEGGADISSKNKFEDNINIKKLDSKEKEEKQNYKPKEEYYVLLLKFSEKGIESNKKINLNIELTEQNTKYIYRTIRIIKLNNNRVLFLFLCGKDYNYYHIFYKYDNKKETLGLEYKDKYNLNHSLGLFLPYEETFFNYGSILDIYSRRYMPFMYFYKNKNYIPLLCIINKKDKLNNCIIFNKKYLIALFAYSIEKYEIKEENILFISKFSFGDNCTKFIFKNEVNMIIVYQDKNYFESKEDNKYLYFLEIDENYNKINEEAIKCDDYYVRILYKEKKFYLLRSNNLGIYESQLLNK